MCSPSRRRWRSWPGVPAGLTDAGARQLAGELGFLPLALAQAAAVIAAQHLDYPAYLARLRAVPVQDLLKRVIGEPYPHSVAEAIVLALDAVAEGDPTGLCRGLINVVALLSTGRGVPGAAVRRRAARPAPALRVQGEGERIPNAERLLGRRVLMRRSGGWPARRC